MHRHLIFCTRIAFALAGPLLFASATTTPLNLTASEQATGQGGTIQGVITDPTNAAVAGATVSLTNSVTSFNQTLKTQQDGSFRFPNVPLNTYTLQIESTGFQKYTQTINVRTQVPIEQNVNLVLAGTQQTVTVEATPDTIENVPTSHVDVSQNLIADLPTTSSSSGLNEIIPLTSPGVVADSNGFFHPQGDHGETSYVVDGFVIGDQQSKTFSTQLPSNAFESLELVSSAPDAEFGGKTSLVVNATTRSGMGQPSRVSLDTYYGSFGTEGEDFTLSAGGSNWGNFFLIDTSNTGRFLDSPEFSPIHDHGNNESIFDRVDYQPGSRDSLHLDIFGGRNWFQIPNTYDQSSQDQHQQARTFSFSLGYQHTFNTEMLLTVSPFVRQDRVDYYPSDNPFADSPATIQQDRHLTNWGTRVNLSYSHGVHNIKIGAEGQQTRLLENFSLGITDPTFNAVCLSVAGAAVTTGSFTNPSECGAAGLTPNPGFSPGLFPYDLTRGGGLFHFHGAADINQGAFFAQDQVTIKNLTLSAGLRFDQYEGISEDKLLQPRLGFSYLIKATATVIQGSYTRAMETPYNENLVLSSDTGAGGLATNVFGAYASSPLRPGHRNQYSTGIEQAIKKYVQIEASYFWKFTKDAFDFDTLFNTSVAFPIEWHQSKIDGVNLRVSTSNFHGFQAYSTLGHTRARFFGPESGGLIFNSPLDTGVFRIDHDQNLQQTSYLRYQHGKEGWWAMFTWRYDSGEVAGAVTDLDDALALTGDEQAAIGFHCGGDYATLNNPITSCSGSYGATRLVIPAPGTYNPDHNPPRIAPRNLFDAGIGTDNLFHKEKFKTDLKLTALNITNSEALYNFLSTFSGTHWVTPRALQVTLGWVY